MYSLDELKYQNLEISQLCEVLSILMEERPLHDNPYVRELMGRFKEKVWVHLVFEDNTFYSKLLQCEDQGVREAAQAFHESAKEIKRRFSEFVRHWCSSPESEDEHAMLTKESKEIFELIKNRIAYENDKIFPIVEQELCH